MVDVLYAGVPRFALALMRAGHRLGAICLPWLDEEEETWELVRHASREGIPLFPAQALTSDASDEERTALESLGPFDLLLVMSFERRVEPWACALGKDGAWNVHPSLLPRHRGYNPYFWTVFHGDTQAGVTLHQITPRFDAGDVLAQRTVEVPREGTSGQLWERLQDASEAMILEVLANVDNGKSPVPVPQDARLATPARKPREEDLLLDLNASATDVVRHIRAATPEPGALLQLGEELLVIRGAALGPPPPPGSAPGTLFQHEGFTCVATGNGSFRPFSVERSEVLVDLATWREKP